MKKLTAFNLYERKEPRGWHDAPESAPGKGVEVCLASDVANLETRLIECETAMLMATSGSAPGVAKYMAKYPDPYVQS